MGTPHFSTPPPLFSTRPHTPTHFPAPSTLTPYTFPHLSHTYPLLPYCPILDSTFQTKKKIPNFPTIHTPPNSLHSPDSFPYSLHTYFIIYPVSKFLTFIIYCLISLAIKYTRRIKNFENQNKTWQQNI